MPPMPYHLEKGPMLAVIEDYLDDDQRALDTLAAMRNPNTKLWKLPVFDSKTLLNNQGQKFRDYALDMKVNWFGIDAAVSATKQPAFDPATNSTTGTWQAYYGDVDEITRETISRALEIALGVRHGDPVPKRPERHWPIDFYWKCGQAWFEGWVTWRTSREGASRVVVIFATPHDGTAVLADPASGTMSADFAVSPPDQAFETRGAGMLVVTHENHKEHPPTASKAVGSGQPSPGLAWPRPGARYQGTGAIIAVSPAEVDGGVKIRPRRYEKP